MYNTAFWLWKRLVNICIYPPTLDNVCLTCLANIGLGFFSRTQISLHKLYPPIYAEYYGVSFKMVKASHDWIPLNLTRYTMFLSQHILAKFWHFNNDLTTIEISCHAIFYIRHSFGECCWDIHLQVNLRFRFLKCKYSQVVIRRQNYRLQNFI